MDRVQKLLRRALTHEIFLKLRLNKYQKWKLFVENHPRSGFFISVWHKGRNENVQARKAIYVRILSCKIIYIKLKWKKHVQSYYIVLSQIAPLLLKIAPFFVFPHQNLALLLLPKKYLQMYCMWNIHKVTYLIYHSRPLTTPNLQTDHSTWQRKMV